MAKEPVASHTGTTQQRLDRQLGDDRRELQRDVEFLSDALRLRGRLRLPADGGPHPLVILAHGLGGLKEWTIPDVATALVDAGIAALAFDYRNFGDSDGEPREEVDHCGQIEDWQSAITFAATLPGIDPRRIGLWGTSLGGRDVLAVAALDARVKCVFAQVPLIHAPASAGATMFAGGDVAEFERMLAEDRRDRALGKPPRYISFDAGPDTEHGEYWATFGDSERRNWNPRLTIRSLAPTVASDIRHLMRLIAPKPLRMVVAERDSVCPTDGQIAAFADAAEPKSLVRFDGHHYCVYTTWKDAAIASARDWFVEHLLGDAAR